MHFVGAVLDEPRRRAVGNGESKLFEPAFGYAVRRLDGREVLRPDGICNAAPKEIRLFGGKYSTDVLLEASIS